MTDVDLHETMDAIAAGAAAPPADLLDRVAAGRHRQRRRRTAVAAVAAVALLAGAAWAGAHVSTRRADVPAEYTPFHVPPSVAERPLVYGAWPNAKLPFPEQPSTREGRPVRVLDQIDSFFLLVADRDTFWNVNPEAGRYLPIVTGTGVDGVRHPDRIAVTPNWIVWLADRVSAGEFAVYRTPHGGGSMELVTVVRQDPGTVRGRLYATDEHVYWSTPDGVTRVSQSDGTTSTLPGFAGMVTDGTPWATRPSPDPREFRNVVTGEVRTVTAAAMVDPGGLRCIPAFCVAPARSGDGSWFVQRPDGSHPTRLPAAVRTLGATNDSGVILLTDHTLLDPVSGRFGVGIFEGQEVCADSGAGASGRFVYRWSVREAPGGRCGDPWVLYLPDPD